MRVFVDTNVLVSALLFRGSRVAECVERIIESHTMVLSEQVLAEFRAVMVRKFPDKARQVERFLAQLNYETAPVPEDDGPFELPAVRDETDQFILGAAVEAQCDCVVSGDKDLLEVDTDVISIMRPASFLEARLAGNQRWDEDTEQP